MKVKLLIALGLSATSSCLCLVQHRLSVPSLASFDFRYRQSHHDVVDIATPAPRAHVRAGLVERSQKIQYNVPKRQLRVILHAKDSEQDGDTTGEDLSEGINNDDNTLSQRLLPRCYIACKYVFTAMSLLIFTTPDRSLGMMLQQHWSGGAGYACAAALCGILHTAHANGRQSSDTYKRLHIGLALFSMINLPAIPGEAGFFLSSHQRAMISLLTGARLLGATTALWGWKSSLKKTPLKELTSGIVETIQGLRVIDKKAALSYRNSLLLVLAAATSSFLQGRFLLSYRKDFLTTNFQISLQWSAFARLSMLATMIYTLKDAAERDRLGGTTFIQLNTLVGLAAVAAGLGQACYPAVTAARRGVLFFFFSGLFFLRAYRGKLSKQLKKQ